MPIRTASGLRASSGLRSSAQRPAGKNLIRNSSFEYGLSGWSGDSDKLYVTSETAYDGNKSLRWNAVGSYANIEYPNNTTAPIIVKASTDYTISFYFKGAGSSVIAHLQINRNHTYGTNVASLALTGTDGEWVRKSLTFNSGANTSLYLRFYDQEYTGTMYLDAFQLEEGSSATAYEFTSPTPSNYIRIPVDLSEVEFMGSGTWQGINIPWLNYETGGETAHDGYANGFQNAYFNGTNGNASLQNQLSVLRDNEFKFIRVWLQLYHNMNADKDTVGYTGFINGFLTNLATYLDWCASEGIKVCVCIDDSWYTFPWTWINDEDKRTSYIQACVDLVNAIKNKSALWGFDYANEPYQGWSDTTTRTINGSPVDIGYNRTYLTTFFTDLYTALKAVSPNHYFSVGDAKFAEVRDYNLSTCCDYYQIHLYYTSHHNLNYHSSMFDKPIMVGEWGFGDSNNYANNIPFNEAMIGSLFMRGFNLHCLWSAGQILNRTGTATYEIGSGIKGFLHYQ